MTLKWLVFAVLVAGAAAASIRHRRTGARDIPVQVVYDAPDGVLAGVHNLDDKPHIPIPEKQEGTKNMEAKPQLSVEEKKDALKNLPTPVDEANKVKIVTPDEPVEVIQPVQPVPNAAYQQEENIDDIYEKIQEIINNGAKKIKDDFEQIPEDSNKQEVLTKVNCTLEEFLESTKKLISLRNIPTLKQDSTTSSPLPNPVNIFQQIVSSFQTFSSSLFSGLNPNGGNVQNEGATAAPGGFPNPIEVAQGIFSQVQNNLAGLFSQRPPAAQSDETPAGNQNPLQFIQQQISNIFNRPTTAPGTQSDEQPPQTNPIVGFVQTAISNVQNALNPSTAAPAAHDEVTQGTTPGNNPLTIIQNAGQSVLGAIQNNPFFPGSSTQTPAAGTTGPAHYEASTAASNPAVGALANAQNQLAQVIPNNPLQQQAQQQAQQAVATGTSQANEVVAQLNQQGVPVPDQVSSAIGSAQQIAGQAATTAKPARAPASETPAADEAAVAFDDIAEEVPVDEVKEEVPVEADPELPAKVEEPVKEEPGKEEAVPVQAEELSNEVTEEKKEVEP